MLTRVTEQGLCIPKELLAGMTDVEIRRENGFVIIAPVEDPILHLGQDPLDDDITDASTHHDQYLH